MKALASSLGAWEQIERAERTSKRHGLAFPLAVVQAIGAPHGLAMTPEESSPLPALTFDAIMISVLDARLMMGTAARFASWGVPMRRQQRHRLHPWVIAGGQGLHNPMPYYDVADAIVVGDAEEPMPHLLAAWERHGRTPGFLAACSTIPGVLVPLYHRPEETTIAQAVSLDIGTTIRCDVRVNLNGSRRVEIARNCRHKCLFCGLGWRAPMRENPTCEILSAIDGSPKQIHLQAGDAESHSGINEIREALRERGAVDAGWTGRLDSVEGEDPIAGNKRYAFGVEGMTARVRAAIGKAYLTDERIVTSTCDVMERTEGEGKGRIAWHMIAGLPGEQRDDALAFTRLLQRLDERRRGRTARNLSLHWQPFQPLPGTPMQWCACGGGARRLVNMVRGVEGMPWVQIRQHAGRTDDVASVCTVLARSDRRGVDLLEAIGQRRITPDEAAEIAGVGWGALDPDALLPWDWIQHAYPRKVLRLAFDVMRRRLP